MISEAKEFADLFNLFCNQTLDYNLMNAYQLAERLRAMVSGLPVEQARFYLAYADFAPFIGDIEGGAEAYSQTRHHRNVNGGAPVHSILDGYTAVDVLAYVAAKARTHQIVMAGEEHMSAQTRCLMLPLLRLLHRLGYRYFAAETFLAPLDVTVQAGCALLHTGYYSRDPVYAEAVNEALRLGFTLVSYEMSDMPDEIRAADMRTRTNYRELAQAKNLQSLLVKDPLAKVFVWAGRGHVYTESMKSNTGESDWEPMAFHVQRLTGITPLSLILCRQLGAVLPDRESPEYRYAAAKGWLNTPSVFVRDDLPFDDLGAAQVFFPRQSYSGGRADWLTTIVGRVSRPVPGTILFAEGPQLVQAFEKAHPHNALPIDRFIVHSPTSCPPLMLPPGRSFAVSAINARGESHGEVEVDT